MPRGFWGSNALLLSAMASTWLVEEIGSSCAEQLLWARAPLHPSRPGLFLICVLKESSLCTLMKFVELEAECPLVAEQWKGSIAFPHHLLKVSCRAEVSGKEGGGKKSDVGSRGGCACGVLPSMGGGVGAAALCGAWLDSCISEVSALILGGR